MPYMGIRGRRSRGATGRPLRPMDWYALESFQASVTVGTPIRQWAILPSTIREELTDPTLMFSQLSFAATNVAQPASNASILRLGLIQWGYGPTDAVPVPAPDPAQPYSADWIWLLELPLVTDQEAFTVFHSIDAAERWVLSKAKRRLGQDKSLLWVGSAEGVVGWNVHLHGRALLKE